MMTQKWYQIEVYAQKTIHVKAKNRREAKKKARVKFRKNPGKLDMDDCEEVW
jgi:hypothetical protein